MQNKPIKVVAAIIWKGDLFLSAKRPDGKDYAGFWEFPGGKVEPNETLEEALNRELNEELNISVNSAKYWLTKVVEYKEYTVELNFFDVYEFSGQLKCLENQIYDFFSLTEDLKIKLLPVNYEIVELLREREEQNKGRIYEN